MMALEWSKSSDRRMPWAEAHEWCRTLREGGHDDWRLPTLEELLTIVDYARSNPACALPDTVANVYWSATTLATSPSFAWAVSFGAGSVGFDVKGYDFYVRGVRSGSDPSPLRPLDPSCPHCGQGVRLVAVS
jgi:hypothetical protein